MEQYVQVINSILDPWRSLSSAENETLSLPAPDALDENRMLGVIQLYIFRHNAVACPIDQPRSSITIRSHQGTEPILEFVAVKPALFSGALG